MHLLVLLALTGCGPLPEGSFEGECSDGLDNDGDGTSDCDDDACGADCGGCLALREVCINEFMAENDSTLRDGDGEYSDWIELFNPSESGRSLDGFTITDDLSDPRQHALNGLVIQGRGTLLLWASGDVTAGDKHLPFKLSVDGDELGLYCPQGDPADELKWTEYQGADVSTARIPNCDGAMMPGATPTPAASNTP